MALATSVIRYSTIAIALALSVPNSVTAMEAPSFDPDKDNVDGALKTLTWLPPADLQPPVIKTDLYKVIDVPVDPSWQRVEEFWQPGVPRVQGYHHDAMVKFGNEAPRVDHQQVGRWITYDRDGHVLTDGSWNSHGIRVGPFIFNYDPDQNQNVRVKKDEPLPLQRIEVNGARSLADPVPAGATALLDTTVDTQMIEQISFYPNGDVESFVQYDTGHGKTPTDVIGLRLVRFHPAPPAPSARRQAFDLRAPVIPQQAQPAGDAKQHVAEFAIQTSGDHATRVTALFNANGQPKEFSSGILGSSLPSDPNNWKFTWLYTDGVFDGLTCGGHEFLNNVRPNDVPLAKLRRVVIWRTPGKWEDGILAIGFGMRGADQQWQAAGTWVFWDDQAKVTGFGAYREGKPQGPWTEHRYVDLNKEHVLIETARGSYQAGARNGIWQMDLFKGHPDLAGVKETTENSSKGFIRRVTYANGAATATDNNFR